MIDVATLSKLPEHLIALQTLIDRCHDAPCKKELIVVAAGCGAIDGDDGHLMVTANQLETA